MEAIVLAGGFGTRLRPVVSDVPKPMAPVGGRPFLEHLVGYWIEQGVRRFVVSVGYLAERIVDYFGSAWRGAEFAYAREQTPLGTGGGLLLALDEVTSPRVLVLNGDSFFRVVLAEALAFHQSRNADCSLNLFRSRDTRRYLGLDLEDNGRVRSFSAPGDAVTALVNGGVYLFRTATLRALPWKSGERASLEADILPHGMSAGWRIYGRECRGAFIDIGVPEDYARAAEVMQA